MEKVLGLQGLRIDREEHAVYLAGTSSVSLNCSSCSISGGC